MINLKPKVKKFILSNFLLLAPVSEYKLLIHILVYKKQIKLLMRFKSRSNNYCQILPCKKLFQGNFNLSVLNCRNFFSCILWIQSQHNNTFFKLQGSLKHQIQSVATSFSYWKLNCVRYNFFNLVQFLNLVL